MEKQSTRIEKKKAYDREYANRPDIKEARKEYRRQWRARKKAEDPDYWRKEVGSKETRDRAQKKYRETHKEVLAEKARNFYHKARDKNIQNMKNYRASKKAEDPEYYKKQAAKQNQDKIKARSKAAELPLDDACKMCGIKKNLERHHPDYARPKYFITLCKSCHAFTHRKY